MSLVKEELGAFKIYAGIPVRCIKERSGKMLDMYLDGGSDV